MSSNSASTPFFHPVLKRITIVFFILFIISIALIAYFSPKSPWQKNNLTKETSTLKPQTTITLPKGQALAQSTTATPTPTPSVESSAENQPSITAINDTISPPASTSIPKPEPTQAPPEPVQCPGKSQPMIKGVIVNNQKYYYKKGMQHYFLIGTVVPVNRWFCNENEAKSDGWEPANLSILKLLR